MNSLKFIAVFLAGAAVGVVAVLRYAEKKYRAIAEEEIASVKEKFTVPRSGDSKPVPVPRSDEESESAHASRYQDILKNSVPVDYSGYKGKAETQDKPYIIPPDEFGEFSDYETITLTYYQGAGVLTDGAENEVDDIEEIVGMDSLDHFGEYENDAVYVRNDAKKCDYEILLSLLDYDPTEG